jgi:hypothetical protein
MTSSRQTVSQIRHNLTSYQKIGNSPSVS